jgi:hypothetical protein
VRLGCRADAAAWVPWHRHPRNFKPLGIDEAQFTRLDGKPHEQLQGLVCLHEAHHASGRGEHPECAAGRIRALEAGLKEAGIAARPWRLRIHDQQLARPLNDRGNHQWLVYSHAEAVDELSGFKAIGAVEHDICLSNPARQVLCMAVLGLGQDGAKRRAVRKACLARQHLGPTHIPRAKQHLTRQVGGIDRVAIDPTQAAHTGCSKVLGCGAAKPTGPHHQNLGMPEPLQGCIVDLRQQELAAEGSLLVERAELGHDAPRLLGLWRRWVGRHGLALQQGHGLFELVVIGRPKCNRLAIGCRLLALGAALRARALLRALAIVEVPV